MNNTNENNDTETSIADQLQVLQAFISKGASQESAKDMLNRISIMRTNNDSKQYKINETDVLTHDLSTLSEQMQAKMPMYFFVDPEQARTPNTPFSPLQKAVNVMGQDQVNESSPFFALKEAIKGQMNPDNPNPNMAVFRKIRIAQGAKFRPI